MVGAGARGKQYNRRPWQREQVVRINKTVVVYIVGTRKLEITPKQETVLSVKGAG